MSLLNEVCDRWLTTDSGSQGRDSTVLALDTLRGLRMTTRAPKTREGASDGLLHSSLAIPNTADQAESLTGATLNPNSLADRASRRAPFSVKTSSRLAENLRPSTGAMGTTGGKKRADEMEYGEGDVGAAEWASRSLETGQGTKEFVVDIAGKGGGDLISASYLVRHCLAQVLVSRNTTSGSYQLGAGLGLRARRGIVWAWRVVWWACKRGNEPRWGQR